MLWAGGRGVRLLSAGGVQERQGQLWSSRMGLADWELEEEGRRISGG